MIELKLKPKPPFDFHLTVTHMFVLPPAKYSNGIFTRVLGLESRKLVKLSIMSKGTVNEPKLCVSIESPSGLNKEDEKEILNKVTFMFSLDEDLSEFYSLAAKDSVLRQAKNDLYGLKIQTSPCLFEGMIIGFCLVWTSFQRAVAMIERLVKEFGQQIDKEFAFPRAEELSKASISKLKKLKLGFRAERIKWLSTQVAQGKLDLGRLPSLPTEILKEELVKIKWVGPWLAEGIMLWRMKRTEAFPLDVWSAKIFRAFFPEMRSQSVEEIAEFAMHRWGKYRGLSYYYLMCDREELLKKFNLK